MLLRTQSKPDVVCAQCGRPCARRSRQQKFCSPVCRKRFHESGRFRHARRTALYLPTGMPDGPPKNSTNPMACKGQKRDRASRGMSSGPAGNCPVPSRRIAT